jgi:phosphatidate cytidylyltransferase
MPPSQNLVQRILVAAIAIPAVVGIIWLGGWVLATTLAVLGVLGAREIYDFGRRQGIEALERAGWIAAAATPLLTYWGKAPVLFLGAIWLMLTLVLAMVRRGPSGRPLTSVSITLFGFVYASGMLAFLIAIRHGGRGGSAAAIHPAAYVLLTLFPLVITWICDTAAMAVGTAVGGTKLAPVLSPKKTHAGAVGGTLGGVITALALGKFVLNRPGWGGWSFSDGQLLLFGLVVSIVGQIGDVAESLFKREAGVKDSSALIPGHGGVLDRLDSLYFVIPTAAGLYRMFGMI